MNCLILAAGKNTRLDTGMPKSLVSVNGETLLSRHIRIFKACGVTNFCIISGYGGKKLEDYLPTLIKEHQVEISIYYNDRFDLENGFSVFRSQEWVDKWSIKDFFLTMGDHIFDPEFVKKFITDSASTSEHLKLAVDLPGESNNHVDIDDVTKVKASEDFMIEAIGKEISEYSHYDTGLFRLDSAVFDVFQKSFDQEKYTISDSVSELIKSKQARAIPVFGFIWNDVDNPDDLQKTRDLIEEDKL